MVVATQNPVEYEGTYPLPEAQLDRFFFKLAVDTPDQPTEAAMLRRIDAGLNPHDLVAAGVTAVIDAAALTAARAEAELQGIGEADAVERTLARVPVPR